MFISVLIFFGAMSVGVLASARWLPDLAEGRVAGLAFFLVCGMLGAALGLLAIHVYDVVEDLNGFQRNDLFDKRQIVAGALRTTVLDSGLMVGLASVVYLLAPPPDEDEEPRAGAVAESPV